MNLLLATTALMGCSHHRPPVSGAESVWSVPLARADLTVEGQADGLVMWEIHVNDAWVSDFLGQEALDRCREHLNTSDLCFVHPWPCARVQVQPQTSYLFMWTGHCVDPDPRTWHLGMGGGVRTFQVDAESVPMLRLDQPELRVFALPEAKAPTP